MSEPEQEVGLSRGEHLLRVGLTLVGTVAFCLWSRSWETWQRAVYDLAATPVVMFAGAAIVVDALNRARRDGRWWGQVLLMIPAAIIPPGAEFRAWPLSGHLTDVFIAVGAVWIGRRPWWLRAWAVAAAGVCLLLRWTHWDEGSHVRTYNAAIVAALCVAAAWGLAAVLDRRRGAGVRGAHRD